MGWVYSDLFDFSTKENCRKEFLEELPNHFKFIDDCKNKDGYFQVLFDTKANKYVCDVFLLNKDDGEWGYKDISDDMGPNEPCPLKMLKYLEKNDKNLMNEYSLDWIMQSRNEIEANKNKNKFQFQVGDKLVFKDSGLQTKDNEVFKEIEILFIDKKDYIIKVLDNSKLIEEFRLSKTLLNKKDFVIFRNNKEYKNEKSLVEIKNAIKNDGMYLKDVFEDLPKENNREVYADLCNIAINENGWSLKYVNFENLPLENNREIYTDLCKKAVKSVNLSVKHVNFENLSLENNREIYYQLFKEAVNKKGEVLEDLKIENLPLENNREIYAKLCEIAINQDSKYLYKVKFENLPEENNREIYADLCKKAVNKDGWVLKYIEFENLPEENNKEIYADLCKEALSKEVVEQKGKVYVKVKNLPEQFQNLEGDNLKNAILNYTPIVDKGLSM